MFFIGLLMLLLLMMMICLLLAWGSLCDFIVCEMYNSCLCRSHSVIICLETAYIAFNFTFFKDLHMYTHRVTIASFYTCRTSGDSLWASPSGAWDPN